MICYYFPPSRTSAIARSVGFAENLVRVGWEPTVLTVAKPRDTWGIKSLDAPLPQQISIVRAREVNLNRLVDLLDTLVNKARLLLGLKGGRYYFRDLLCIPDPQIAWLAFFKAVTFARRKDCIYVTCSPFSSAVLGGLVKVFSRRPLVLDFRDAWRLNPHGLEHTRIHNWVVALMEKWVIKTCDRLVLNTRGALTAYQREYPEYARKMMWIPNGYDKLNLPAPEECKRDKFVIMHVGSLYGTRDPALLLEALTELNHRDIEFVQVGGGFESYDHYKDHVTITLINSVPPEEALRLMRSASLLYLKQGLEKNDTQYVAVAAKTYEYIATGLPILVDCPPGDNIDIVREYAEHAYIVTEANKEQIKEAILSAYGRRSAVTPSIRARFVDDFDRLNLTKKLARAMEEIVRTHVTPL
ncbi:MAG: hypothetical protein A2W25_11580 [candidate division Zixibacteria bacterium RBG_16_53_22]|nr:MAG: hypothetical protein A2W25_11580 [candidate division Zixibacteria bacterium RBG_16_53_22]